MRGTRLASERHDASFRGRGVQATFGPSNGGCLDSCLKVHERKVPRDPPGAYGNLIVDGKPLGWVNDKYLDKSLREDKRQCILPAPTSPRLDEILSAHPHLEGVCIGGP